METSFVVWWRFYGDTLIFKVNCNGGVGFYGGGVLMVRWNFMMWDFQNSGVSMVRKWCFYGGLRWSENGVKVWWA